MSGIQMAAVGLGSTLATLSNASPETTGNSPVTTGIEFNVDGRLTSSHTSGGGTVISNQVNTRWCNPAGNPAASIRATLSSGATPTTGTLNTWQSLSSTRSWSLTSTATDSTVLLIQISLDGGTTVHTSATYTLFNGVVA